MTHNKHLTVLYFEDNDPISVKSSAQIFLLFSFLITGLCKSLASYSFTLTPDPVSLSKILYDILAKAL